MDIIIEQSAAVYERRHQCTGVSISSPKVNEQLVCETNDPNYNYRIDHRDE